MRRPRPHGGRRSRNRRSGLSPDLTGGKHKIAKTTPCKVEISLLPAPRPSPDAARREVCLLQFYSNFQTAKILPRHHAPGVLPENLTLEKSEGAGKTGCAPHPRSRAQCCRGMLRPSKQV